jgi:hypothetical protein
MNDTPDDTLPKRRRSATRKAAKAPALVNEPAVQAILDQALHPDAMPGGNGVQALAEVSQPGRPKPVAKRRAPQKRVKKTVPPPAAAGPAAIPLSPTERSAEGVVGLVATAEEVSEDMPDAGQAETERHGDHDDRAFDDPPPAGHAPPDDGDPPVSDAATAPSHHHWVYLALAVFLLALGFGLWGVWTTWFASDDPSSQSATSLRASSDKLSQEVSTLRRSDQISREANRDLERALAERDEEIAGLRADIAFYERFVGATGQRRGLSVHDLEMQLQSGDVWHFVATLTQNLNRGAVNAGRVTLSVEGTRNDRLEKLSWSSLRKQTNAPGESYSFKYFQQVEGEVMLPKDFKPLRVTVRLVPAGGSAVEQSFPWPDAVRGGG